MDIMATNVYVKINYDRLRIDNALGNWKCDNNSNKNDNKMNNVLSAWGPSPGTITRLLVCFYYQLSKDEVVLYALWRSMLRQTAHAMCVSSIVDLCQAHVHYCQLSSWVASESAVCCAISGRCLNQMFAWQHVMTVQTSMRYTEIEVSPDGWRSQDMEPGRGPLSPWTLFCLCLFLLIALKFWQYATVVVRTVGWTSLAIS